MDQKLLDEVRVAAVELSEAVTKLLGGWRDKEPPAFTLYHFTDCAGLVGILTTKTLCASLATSLNDASETKYAISRLRSNLETKAVALKHLRENSLLEYSDQRKFRRDFRTYVCSFCGAAEAVHWLHYGRSGTGVAVGFDSLSLYKVRQFTLYPVIYEPKEQDALLGAVLDLVDRCASKFAIHQELLNEFFPELAVSYLRLLAPRMKDPAFKSENEWRLISNEEWVAGEAADPTRDTHFRSENGRIIPYKKIEFTTLPVRHVELGASSPIEVSDQALSVLMENTLGEARHVSRSNVPVRP